MHAICFSQLQEWMLGLLDSSRSVHVPRYMWCREGCAWERVEEVEDDGRKLPLYPYHMMVVKWEVACDLVPKRLERCGE